MAAVQVLINGIMWDNKSDKHTHVTILGQASLADLQVGGGPIIPPAQPPGIWGGGNQPFPTPPIPIYPGGTPNPPDPYPDPPPEGTKPPPPGGGWGYSPEYGWGYFPGGGGKPQPGGLGK